MKITIRNAKEPKVPTKEIRQAVLFYANLILTPRQSKNLELEICFKDFPRTYKGDCIWLDRPVRPHEFKIRLSSRFKTPTTLRTLAHEMVHLRQYAIGELTSETMRSGIRWKREEIDEEKIHYYDHPWEIEAFGREIGLYYRYLDHKRLKVKSMK